MKKGFTLVELLVVIAILSLFGVLILLIFTRSLRGSNKSQIIAMIKQNGQSILEVMDKTVRGADRVVCANNLASEGPTIVVVKNGLYTRYRYKVFTSNANGYIQQDTFNLSAAVPSGTNDTFYIRDFERSSIITGERTLCTDPPVQNPQSIQTITDTNPQTGVSVKSASFKNTPGNGYKDIVTVKFQIGPGEKAPEAVAGQIDPVTFQTTVQLR